LVRRACLHRTYGHLVRGRSHAPPFAVTAAEAATLVPAALALARYTPPAGLPLADDAENLRFADAASYWRGTLWPGTP
jgi:hypothetical protein